MNNDGFFTSSSLKYWTAVIMTVAVTTATLGRAWRRDENRRWVVGWFIPFFWGYWMVRRGHFDARTWLSLFFAVGFCGAVKVGYEGYVNALSAEAIRVNRATYGHRTK